MLKILKKIIGLKVCEHNEYTDIDISNDWFVDSDGKEYRMYIRACKNCKNREKIRKYK